MRLSRALAGVPLVFCCGLTACGPSDSVPEDPDETAEEVRALTREQIQEHAEAMSPEVAESLGIVDTTIGIESPMPVDSVRPLDFDPDTAPAL